MDGVVKLTLKGNCFNLNEKLFLFKKSDSNRNNILFSFKLFYSRESFIFVLHKRTERKNCLHCFYFFFLSLVFSWRASTIVCTKNCPNKCCIFFFSFVSFILFRSFRQVKFSLLSLILEKKKNCSKRSSSFGVVVVVVFISMWRE